MNGRTVTADLLLGMIPIALLIAVWQGVISFGLAPATLLPPPGLVFIRMAEQLVTASFDQEILAGFNVHTVAVMGIFGIFGRHVADGQILAHERMQTPGRGVLERNAV